MTILYSNIKRKFISIHNINKIIILITREPNVLQMRQINTISVVKWSICRIWINNKIFNIEGRLVDQRYTITRVTQYKKKSL